MRCPRCNSKITIEKYVKAYTDDRMLKEFYCSECQYYDVLEVGPDETLEDYVERKLQEIHPAIKQDIIDCYSDDVKESYNELILEQVKEKKIHITINVYTSKEV